MSENKDLLNKTLSGQIYNPQALATPGLNGATPVRLFISYLPGLEPEPLNASMAEIIRSLGAKYEVFVDRAFSSKQEWAERTKLELEKADFLILFLSARTSKSEMLSTELALAYRLNQLNRGRPGIIPVRLAFTGVLEYPVSAYLEGISALHWTRASDTPDLLGELEKLIEGREVVPLPLAPVVEAAEGEPVPLPPEMLPSESYPEPLPQAQLPVLEMPEGTMPAHSSFYIERAADRVAFETIKRQGVTITIKAPRQMGKSSLLLRTCQAALLSGKRVALLDFQLFDRAALAAPDTFFRQFCEWLADELEIESRVEEYFAAPLGNSQRCTRYIQRYLLKELGGPLLLAMDEVESIFDTPFRSDFFGMLRSWHNARQTNSLWKQLDLVLVTSTEPYQLIQNLNQSPFNVGEVLELDDFNYEQVAELNHRHGSPLNEKQLSELMQLLNGHPYLVRKALYLVASGRIGVNELFSKALDDRGTFGDHLRNQLFRLHNKPELVEGMRQVLRSSSCQDELVFFRLRGAGLVRREGRRVVPRCQLYAAYFQQALLPAKDTGYDPKPDETLIGLNSVLKSGVPNSSGPFRENGELKREESFEGLTSREREVLRLLVAGLSNAQIADKLTLSVHTVNSHLTTIYAKLGVGSRTEAIRYTLDHKLV